MPKDDGAESIGIGLDACVIPLRHANLFLVQTTDFFYPLVDDPYVMGRIACCNTLSDLYAMGVADCDNMLMLLALPTKMEHDVRHKVTELLMKGFADCAAEAGCSVRGGQTVFNPWLTIGGVATSVCAKDEFTMPNSAKAGDVIVLTKPIGTQVAVNCYESLTKNPERRDRLLALFDGDAAPIHTCYYRAVDCMARLNRHAARLMRKYSAHAATDVTGFGILGHANNLAEHQTDCVQLQIHNLPILANCVEMLEPFGYDFGLMKGTSAETSGGLLVVLPRDAATAYCKEMCAIPSSEGGGAAWIVGVVTESAERSGVIMPNARVIRVPAVDTADELW